MSRRRGQDPGPRPESSPDGGARRRVVRLAAPAKVNLALHVGARRADGFHEIDTLFQAVDLSDRVEVRLTPRGLTLAVEGPDLGPVEDNLAYRAAQAFVRAVALDVGVSVRLAKEIPAGAGLGGGSSDAAAVLRALNHLAGGALPPGRLMELGAELGSDVPFFLGSSPLARGRGRGEVLEALPPLPAAWLVLVLPPVHVATGAAYAALAEARGGAEGTGLSGRSGPSAEAGGRDASTWSAVHHGVHNDFEPVVAGAHPAVAAALAGLRESGAGPVLLSGSGGACFGFVRDRVEARTAAATVGRRLGWPAVPVRTLERFPEPDAG